MSTESNRSFLLQFLEKIGTPLVLAARGRTLSGPADSGAEEATHLAGLLGKTIEAGLGLGDKFDLQNAGQHADSLRLALAALSAPLVAYDYSKSGKKPEEIDTLKLTKPLESILAFADNFTPAIENTTRLEQLAPGAAQALDENQAVFQYITALTPVLTAVSDFSFGQPEDKLMPDIAARLEKRAQSLRQDLAPALSDPAEQKRAELQLVAALAALYAALHKAEIARLAALSDAERGQEPPNAALQTIWDQFDKRAGMIALLARRSTPAGQSQAAQAPAPAATAPQAPVTAPEPVAQPTTQPAQQQAQTPPPAAPAEPVTPPPAPPAAPESAPADTSSNPMAFFKPGAKAAPLKDDDADEEAL